MAYRINEQQMVDENLFNYEKHIKSPMVRFQDTTPVFTTYYHVVSDETTTDTGFKDVASIIGYRSPIRYNRTEKFPLYGLDPIVLQLDDSDQGLDSSYEGDAIVLPNTIKPLQNDYFIIPTLHDCYLFRVTGIQYDNTMPDNFYRINFKLDYLDSTKLEELNKQVNDEYICTLENIGTENNCIVEKSINCDIEKIQQMYQEITSSYKAMFYNERHNVFMAELDPIHSIYDPLQTEFINKHSLFNQKNDLETLILTDQFRDAKRPLKYEKSVYRFIERPDIRLIKNFDYACAPGITFHESTFYRWHDKHAMILDIPDHLPINAKHIFSNEFIMDVKMNGEDVNEYSKLLKKYIRGEELHIKDISLKLNEEFLYLNDSLEVFFITPIILYIIRNIIYNDMKIKK